MDETADSAIEAQVQLAETGVDIIGISSHGNCSWLPGFLLPGQSQDPASIV